MRGATPPRCRATVSKTFAAGRSGTLPVSRTCRVCAILPPSVLPDLAGGADEVVELALFVIGGEAIDLGARGEAALRAEAEPRHVDVTRGFLDAALQFIDRLQLLQLGTHQTEYDDLVLRHEAQRLEIAGARRVVFE